MKNIFKIKNFFKKRNPISQKIIDGILSFLDEKFIYKRNCFGSKSGYRRIHPNDLIVFNANVFIPNYGKILYGDLNLTKSHSVFIEAKNKFGIDFYILFEMDGRFEKENNPKFKTDAVWNTKTGLKKEYENCFDDNLKFIIE